MKLSAKEVQDLCKEKKISVSELLRRSGVSRTAFYSLCRRSSLLPQSIHALARALGVSEEALLTKSDPEVQKHLRIRRRVKRVLRSHPGCDPDNVRHTLILLEKSPFERLQRALTRGQKIDLYRG